LSPDLHAPCVDLSDLEAVKPCVLVQDATIPAVRVSFVGSSASSRRFGKQGPWGQAFELCSTHSKAGSDLFALHL